MANALQMPSKLMLPPGVRKEIDESEPHLQHMGFKNQIHYTMHLNDEEMGIKPHLLSEMSSPLHTLCMQLLPEVAHQQLLSLLTFLRKRPNISS